MEVVARSVRIEVLGDIERCSRGEDSKFYCLKVRIVFDNGEEREYLLKAHNEPKGLENFLANKKGIRDSLEKRFVLLKNGEVRVSYEDRVER
ncbi:MAG TPA: hypothetical protein EYP11_06085 [Aquificaceae bacterium]|nr:hypothetical protein [Aquificaceae bacterium]HIQ31622.1 hypothetical protein [Aquifex aeolicus]